MRFLVVHPGASFSVHDVHVGWLEALRAAGQSVAEFNLSERLAFYESAYLRVDDDRFRRALDKDGARDLADNGLCAALWKVRPDVLLVISGFFTPPELLDRARRDRVKIVLVHTESPYEDKRQMSMAAHADINLINDPSHLHEFRAVARTEYAPQAYRPSVHHPGPADPGLASDLVFVGTGLPSRCQFLERMDLNGIDLALAGAWQMTPKDWPLRKCVVHDIDDCLENEDTARLYRSARCGINIYRREAEAPELSVGWSMGPREVEMAACGLFFVRDPRPESSEVLGMLPSFVTPEGAGDLVRWYLAHDSERERLAAQARLAVAGRTFDNHAAALLRLLEG